jgi:hypothetical protein
VLDAIAAIKRFADGANAGYDEHIGPPDEND